MDERKVRFRINSDDIEIDLIIKSHNELEIANLIMNKVNKSFIETKGGKLVSIKGIVYRIPKDAKLR